jgi:Cd2+/Zn2+-exporting ATPase
MFMPGPNPSASSALTRLARFLKTEPGVEAVRVDPELRKISVATLGEVDWAGVEAHLREALSEIQGELAAREGRKASVVDGIRVQQSEGETLLEKPSCPTAPTMRQWREVSWFEAEGEVEEDWRLAARDAAICGLCLAVGFALDRWGEMDAAWSRVSYAVALLVGGRDAAIDAWESLRARRLDIHFLMLAVALGAVFVGAWAEGALLLFLFSASGAMEAYAAHRTKGEIGSLLHAAPRRAVRLNREGVEEAVDVAEIGKGDVLVLRPGDLVACDAEILAGETAADESALTGESLPVNKGPGDVLLSGTLNTWGAVRARVLRPARQSALQKIIDLIRSAQHRKAPSQLFTDRFGSGYTWAVLGTALTMFLVWWQVQGVAPFREIDGEHSAFYRAMTLLVVMSPCALVLSIPSAILAAIATGARQGVLFRGGAAVEVLAQVDTVALDKTGTLTTGDLEVEDVHSLPPGREAEVLELACALEAHSTHPVARAIQRHGRRKGITPREVAEFRNHSGLGVSGQDGGQWSVLGRRDLVAKGAVAGLIEAVPLPPPACSEVWVLRGDVVGRILLRDRVRTESAPVLREMRALGLRPLMLTGDRLEVAEAVGRDIGLDPSDIQAGLMPEGKVEAIRALGRAGHTVAMVGDGVNDAPCLAAADVSVAMGARGSDAALEQSDVILMNDRIDLFLQAWRLSRAARSIIRQNLAIALGTVGLMAMAALTGRVPLSVGVLAHEGSTVLVCLNSLRLLFARFKPSTPEAEPSSAVVPSPSSR